MTVPVSWHASPNFWQGRKGRRVVGIVDHSTSGTIAATLNWFSNPVSQVSAHFVIAKTGQIYECVKVNDTAWHAGEVTNPDLSIPWLKNIVEAGDNPNYSTIGIEHEALADEMKSAAYVMPEAQYTASLTLHRYLCQAYNIPRSPLYIIGHKRINGINRPFCPGLAFPFARLISDLAH